MSRSISPPLEFQPTVAMLDEVLDELDELGAAAGGAIDAPARRAALAAYRGFGRDAAYPRRWRYDYAALAFDDLQWMTGRARVPALPRYGRPQHERDDDAPALAVENAGGIVHLSSIYLESPQPAPVRGLTLGALADAKRAGRVNGIHQRVVPPHADPFTSLATAFQNCGAYIEIPESIRLDAPLQIVWTSRPGAASAVFPHTVIRAGAGSHATVIERHLGDAESFVCGIVEIDLAPGAHVDYVVIQQADEGARVSIRRAARCSDGAAIRWHLAEFGGALVRDTTETYLDGPRATAAVNAFAFGRGFAHVDLAIDQYHRAADTSTQTVVRSAVTDRAQGRFRGTIAVSPNASRAHASMDDGTLFLSRNAYRETIPVLDVATGDAAVGHRATVGSLDESALFYVQSRGIARGTAARMLALAFFEPAIARFPDEAIRDEVRTVLDADLDEVPDTFSA